MEFTCELSKLYTISPFEILKQDKDTVIMLINYYIEKGQEQKQPNAVVGGKNNLSEKQNDKQFWSLL